MLIAGESAWRELRAAMLGPALWEMAHLELHLDRGDGDVPIKSCPSGCCGACGLPNPYLPGPCHRTWERLHVVRRDTYFQVEEWP